MTVRHLAGSAAPTKRPATPDRVAPELNLIAGRRIAGAGPRTREVRNPADVDELVAAVREASPEQVDEACAAAARAFPAWRATPPPDRARVLFRYRDRCG
jgi:malonate-semialdehyde dehydrogenase (acetylating)/methylmalonate-semialdehyde dehydrogenase